MDDKLLKRFTVSLSENQLDSLVYEMKNEGLSQVEIYYKFSQFYNLLNSQGYQENKLDEVLVIMDRICGWCSKEENLFSEYLDNDTIRVYQEQLQRNTLVLPKGWFYATPEDSASLWNELQVELPNGHNLFGKTVKVIAHRNGATDDVLCNHLDEPNRFTVIHLTWSMKTEVNEKFPMIEMDGSFEDFLNYEKKFGAQ